VVRYVVDVGPGDSAVRVTVRRRLPEGGLGDVLGELLSWADGCLVVQRRDGTKVTIDEADVVAAKRIPPPPERRR
jgi:N-acetylglutamate synthase